MPQDIDSINKEIREASSLICSEAKKNEQARLLTTILGISSYSADSKRDR